MILVFVCAVAMAVLLTLLVGPLSAAMAVALWLTVFPGALRKYKTARYVGLAACALVAVLGVGVTMIASNAQLPGPTSIASSGLADLATYQATQNVNPQIVRVVCPRGSFAPGSDIVCTAHYPTRSQALNVKLRRADDGALYVNVRVQPVLQGR